MTPYSGRLYKYRAFNVHTLNSLCTRQVFYSSPNSFNDPLDSTPTITMDVSRETASKLRAKYLGSAPSVQGSTPRSKVESVSRRSRKLATSPVEPYLSRVSRELTQHLRSKFEDYGVLSLAEHWDCPLMWSHYADQHRGICIEYDYSGAAFSALRKVEYTDERGVLASELLEMPDFASESSNYWRKLFYTKAPQWSYEREWRDVSERSGLLPSFARVSSVYFGLRCEPAVVAAIAKLLVEIDASVALFKMCVLEGRFKLSATAFDISSFMETNIAGNQEYSFSDYMKLNFWKLARR